MRLLVNGCIMVGGKLLVILVLIVVSVTGVTVASARNGSIEEPEYDVLSKEDNIEIRRYQPMIIAEVKVKSDRKKALNDGFRKLADFIFGKNVKNTDVDMTAPVQQQKQKIARNDSASATTKRENSNDSASATTKRENSNDGAGSNSG